MSHEAPPPHYTQPGLPPQGYPPRQPPAPRANVVGIAALVVGILAVVLSFIPVVNVGAIVLGVVALILAIIGLTRRASGKGTSIAALVLGVVAIIVSAVVLAITAAFVDAVDQNIQDAQNTRVSVEYIATVSDGRANAAYGTSGGISNQSFTGQWTQQDTLTGFDVASLSVTGDPTAGGRQVSCEIRIDGLTVSEQSGESTATCTASTVN